MAATGNCSTLPAGAVPPHGCPMVLLFKNAVFAADGSIASQTGSVDMVIAKDSTGNYSATIPTGRGIGWVGGAYYDASGGARRSFVGRGHSTSVARIVLRLEGLTGASQVMAAADGAEGDSIDVVLGVEL